MRMRALIGTIIVLCAVVVLLIRLADSGDAPRPDLTEEALAPEPVQEPFEAPIVVQEEVPNPAEIEELADVPIGLPVIGYVIDSAGYRVEGATVSLSWLDARRRRGSAETVSDNNGDFLFALPKEHRPTEIGLMATAESGESFRTRFPVTDAGVQDAILTLTRHARVEGRVVNTMGT